MPRFHRLALAALSLFCTAATQAAPQPAPEAEAAGLIIKFKPALRGNSAAAEAAMQGHRASAEARGLAVAFEREGVLGTRVLRLKKRQPAQVLERLARELQASDASIEYAEPDYIAQPALVPNDSNWTSQWNMNGILSGIRAEAAWDINQGFGQRIAIIDTGIRPHADIAANLLPGYDFISDSDAARDGNARDADASDAGDWRDEFECTGKDARNSTWHGTHVAGIAAALGNNGVDVTGVAPKAKIVPIRVLGPCGGTTSDIAAGMVWAIGGSVSGVPVNPNPVRVLNLSLGGYSACGSTYQAAVDAARAAGAIVVTAAGNDQKDSTTFSPANCKGTVVVAASNRNAEKSSYSNTGANVSLSAPGGDVTVEGQANGNVLSLSNSGSTMPVADATRWMRGTSMAAPHVAGAAALMFSVNSLLPAATAEALLKETTHALFECSSGCGSGILDAEAAVKAARGWRPEREPNDSFGQAQYVNVFPARVAGKLDPFLLNEAVDHYSIYLPANTTQRTRLHFQDSAAGMSTNLELFDVNGTLLRSGSMVSGALEISYRNSSSQGKTYYLRLRGKMFFGVPPSAGYRYELRMDRL